ncbi:YsnF/AvaK domain-containing protein [Rubellimicrobium arenae]|uniref:YsnF/AvaK domain-containing protein n=1 Tax=Rubellimicrobium arenae TaxID=2817372 RepID=UPI001B311E19|nr:YsnF/AvaK domain-containing protein [Rubellimicrobium arenae]
MQRAVTAIYRTSEVAELVRRDLEQLGIARHNITVLPDTAGLGGSTLGTGDFAADPMDGLHDLGLPEEDIRTYQQALRNGDFVVSVDVDDEDYLSQVQEIMRRPEEAYDLDDLDNQYADADFIPRQQAAYADTGSMGQMGGGNLNQDGTVRVVEERLNVGKQEVDRGAVRVRSFVREVPVQAEVDLRSTRVYVERRPVDRAVSPGDIATGEQVLEAREYAEQPVVSKEARVVEEIGLREETEVQHQRVQDTVRKTEVEIEDERTGERTSLTGNTSGTSGSGSSGNSGF